MGGGGWTYRVYLTAHRLRYAHIFDPSDSDPNSLHSWTFYHALKLVMTEELRGVQQRNMGIQNRWEEETGDERGTQVT